MPFRLGLPDLSCLHLNLIRLHTVNVLSPARMLKLRPALGYIPPSWTTAPVSMAPNSSWVPACRVGGNLSAKQVLMPAHWRAILVSKALLSLS
ncbi:hypothetical protein CGRA01v4_07272 [Colletotrichum graminicola]|nr:hypothetical protein CGRA01v4_07272 [Colletotrichum graminicola]